MSILSIDETYDPLFGKFWKVWAHGWNTGGGQHSKHYVNAINERLMHMLSLRGGYFHNAINQAVVSLCMWDRIVPDEEYAKIDELANELNAMMRQADPTIKYIVIEFQSSICGNDLCMPVVEIEFDHEWFGIDMRTDKLGPWHERHATCSTHIRIDESNYKGYQNSKPDALPKPKFWDLYPAVTDWKPAAHKIRSVQNRKQDKHKKFIFFPEGEKFRYGSYD